MKTILVIENEGIIRLNILKLLDRNGFNAIGAEDGKIGLELARELVPDLILCNIIMPKLNGYEVLRELNNDPITATIPFIFITAQATPAEVILGQQQGADYYLNKPFTPNELLQAIAKFI
jgi:CheY-like chemotaxis protein